MNVGSIGNGSVLVNPDKFKYQQGTEVTITANSDAGWSFSHWSGDISGDNNPVVVTMNDDKQIIANFIDTIGNSITLDDVDSESSMDD